MKRKNISAPVTLFIPCMLLFTVLSIAQTTGKAVNIVVTPTKTTMIADGKDEAVLHIRIGDKQGNTLTTGDNLVHFSLSGDAKITGIKTGDANSKQQLLNDTSAQQRLFNGQCDVIIRAGTTISTIHFEASTDGLYNGATDIMTVQPGIPHDVTKIAYTFPVSKSTGKAVDKMLGADISFLPQLEKRGMKFYDKGVEGDAIAILKKHGFNYIRLRIFNDPARDSGYSPKDGFCDLQNTLQMAKRIKAAGLKFLLDFHYSDYWADPQKQYKPAAWRNQDFTQLTQSVYDYTKMVMQHLKDQNTLPDMVQVGNEINHGMIWPEGSISNLDSLSQLIYAGINGVKAIAPSTTIMLHIALGGQNDEARFFIDNMLARAVPFDVIGLSYYPQWHGTLQDLTFNITDLSGRYKKDVIVVEYSQLKKEVNDIAFTVKGAKGSCIWEPLSTWERIFDKDGKANDYLYYYDDISKKYLKAK
jgi:beta-galactosidase